MMRLPYIMPADPQPRWVNAEKTMIDVRVIFPHLSNEPALYTAAQSDPGWEHSEEIFARAVAGEFGAICPYVAPPLPVPASISDRQFAHELRARGIITQAEALAFVARGQLPGALAALIAALPTPSARDDAELLIVGATNFERAHPFTKTLAARFGWSSNYIDDFFRAAAGR
ncbi:MAG: hypothetical protein INH13_12335 [Cupriavidus sp.]|nr:hypothetical protein [Cupriavidus sp.]